jgi:hypothetical protein
VVLVEATGIGRGAGFCAALEWHPDVAQDKPARIERIRTLPIVPTYQIYGWVRALEDWTG